MKALTIQSRLAPTRSLSRPSGIDRASVTIAAIDMPRPIWAPVRPTIWVKKTAVPVRNEPVANADSTDWSARSRSSFVSGTIDPSHLVSTSAPQIS